MASGYGSDLSPSVFISLKGYLILKNIQSCFRAQHYRKILIIRIFLIVNQLYLTFRVFIKLENESWKLIWNNMTISNRKTINTTVTRYPWLFSALNRQQCVWHQQTEWWMWGNLSHMSQLGSGTAENRLLTVDFLTVWFQLLRQKC